MLRQQRLVILVALSIGCDLPRLGPPDGGQTVVDGAADGPVVDAGDDAIAIDGSDVDAFDAAPDLVPPEVPSALRHGSVSVALPPAGWASGTAWIHAFYDGHHPAPTNSIEVDWMRIYAVIPAPPPSNEEEIRLVWETVANGSSVDWLQRYPLVPWMAPPGVDLTFNAVADIFGFQPGPDNVYLFGTMRIGAPDFNVPIPANATHCRARARVRLVGSAWAQFGMDFWIDASEQNPVAHRIRAGMTDWFTSTDGQWHEVTLDLVP